MVWSVFSLGVVFLLLALVGWLWLQGRRLQDQSGLPDGTILYTDSGTWFRNDEPLYAHDVRLVGKPDYLVQEPDGSIVPVELKSGRAPSQPWPGHIYQLAAYCLLVEERYGVRPTHGIIQYKDRAFAVDYTDALEEELLDLLVDMREDRFELTLDRNHNDARRCAHCGVRDHCDQRLA